MDIQKSVKSGYLSVKLWMSISKITYTNGPCINSKTTLTSDTIESNMESQDFNAKVQAAFSCLRWNFTNLIFLQGLELISICPYVYCVQWSIRYLYFLFPVSWLRAIQPWWHVLLWRNVTERYYCMVITGRLIVVHIPIILLPNLVTNKHLVIRYHMV